MQNSFKIEISLPASDGFHTRDDAHMADILRDRIEDFLRTDPVTGGGRCKVQIAPAGEPSPMGRKGKRVARYRVIADALRRSIQEGRLRPGDRLPGELELAELYAVSRPTAGRALEMLKQERLVISGQGSGTFVRVPDDLKPVVQLRDELHGRVCRGVACRLQRGVAGEPCRALDALVDRMLQGASDRFLR